ncbi:MAG: hypothetical protein ACI4KR_11930, partial [Ruminiclostridium sp.]
MRIYKKLEINEHQHTNIKVTCSYEPINSCPLCHSTFSELPCRHILIDDKDNFIKLFCFYVCMTCYEGFIAEYSVPAAFVTSDFSSDFSADFDDTPLISPIKVEKRIFDDYLVNLSENFISTYNEAYAAEQHGLKKICGMG